MTPARPEPAAHERIAAVQQQADLARLARFPEQDRAALLTIGMPW
jgi:hypothetical protein